MKCYRCQADNPEGATHCHSCGAHLDPNSTSWVARTVGGCLLIVFIPAGLCGAFFVADVGDNIPFMSILVSVLGIILGIILLQRLR